MTEDQKFKVIIEQTNGWFLYDKNAQYLTKVMVSNGLIMP